MVDLQLNIPIAVNSGTGNNVSVDKSLLIPIASNIGSGIIPITPSVIDIPIAENVATGISIPHWIYPPFNLLDSDDYWLRTVNFESVYPGRKTEIKELKLYNRLPGEVTLTLAGCIVDAQSGTAVETYNAMYLSLDNTNWSKTIDVTISAHDTTTFYIYYRPPSTSTLGNKIWGIGIDYSASVFDLWEYSNFFYVLSMSEEDEEDVVIQKTIPYVSGKMETDFKDIRFYNQNWELKSTILEKVNSDYATFLIKIPLLLADEVIPIYVVGGSSLITPDGYAYHDGWNWFNGEMNGWVQITGNGSWRELIAPGLSTAFGTEHYVLHCGNYGGYPTPSAEAPSTSDTPYGTWTMRIKQSHTTHTDFRYYFAIDSEDNSYSIRFNNWSTPTVSLYLNNDVLASVPYNIGTSPTTITVDHDLDGVFTVSVNGTSIIVEVSDNTITTVAKYKIYLDAYAYSRSVQVDYMYFVEYQSETSPEIGELGEWNDLNYAILTLGKVDYKIQELPMIDASLKYGIRINGVLYE